jgi:hypothetical protein
MPPAVVAFRRFPAVHESTLSFFMMANDGHIEATLGGAGLTLMTTREAKLVKCLEFTAPESKSFPDELTRPLELYEGFRNRCAHAKNVRKVMFCADATASLENGRDVIRLATEFPFLIQAFTSLERVTMGIFSSCESYGQMNVFNEKLEKDLHDSLMNRIYRKVGVMGQLEGTPTYAQVGFFEDWDAPTNLKDMYLSEDFGQDDWGEVRFMCGTVDQWTWKARPGKTM